MLPPRTTPHLPLRLPEQHSSRQEPACWPLRGRRRASDRLRVDETRYCRDAGAARAGYEAEAMARREWLLRAVATRPSRCS
jgi:hypothetical protein